MIAKNQNGKLYLFEKRTGMTAIVSDKELRYLETYCKDGAETEFIQRLKNLGILAADHADVKNAVLDALKNDMDNPQSLHIDITTYCPLHCPQCYKLPGEECNMSKEFFYDLVEQAGKQKVFQIAIGGGEPLTHPDLLDFISAAGSTEMSVSVTTSGFGLSKEMLYDMINAGLNHMQISLNSAKEEINQKSRDGYSHAIHAIRLLSEARLSFGINYVVRRDTLDSLHGLAELAREFHADNINILRYKPSPLEDYETISLDREGFLKLADSIRRIRGVKIKTDSAYSNLLLYLNKGKISQEFCGCGAGKNFLAVTADGKFKPCSHLSFTEEAPSIKDYWEKSKTVARLRDFNGEKSENGAGYGHQGCYSCCYFTLCGGCRAICERTNHVWAEEVDCPAYEGR